MAGLNANTRCIVGRVVAAPAPSDEGAGSESLAMSVLLDGVKLTRQDLTKILPGFPAQLSLPATEQRVFPR